VTCTSGDLQVRQASTGVTDFRLQNSAAFNVWILRTESDANGNNFSILRRDPLDGSTVNTPFQIQSASGDIILDNQFRQETGTAAKPSYGFVANANLGMYRVGTNVLGFATTGVVRATITNAGLRSNIAGTAGAPSYSFNDDADTGMYAILSNQLAFAAGGAKQMSVTIRGVNMQPLPTNTLGLVSGDLWQTGGDVRIVP